MNRYRRRNLFLAIILVLVILAVASTMLAILNRSDGGGIGGLLQDAATETPTPTKTAIPTSGIPDDSSGGEGLPDDGESDNPDRTSTPVVFVPGSGGGSGSGSGSGSGADNPTPNPAVDNGTVFYPVWDCVYAGDDTWVWVAADVTYEDGIPVSSEVLSGPHAGGFQPGCPPSDD